MKLTTALIVAAPPVFVFSFMAIFHPSALTWPAVGFLGLVAGVFAAVVTDLFD